MCPAFFSVLVKALVTPSADLGHVQVHMGCVPHLQEMYASQFVQEIVLGGER